MRRAWYMKDEFISIASHELRTPLASIHGSLKIIHDCLKNQNEEIDKLVDVSIRNSSRLEKILNDLIDIQELESGNTKLRIEEFSLQEFLEQAVEQQKPYSHIINVDVSVDAGCQHIVKADQASLQQVMANLLSNAIKFSPNQSFIAVRGYIHKKKFRPYIFDKFSQAEPSLTRHHQGTGLGLSIVKKIIELHQGKVGFENLEPHGAMFYFEIPLK